MKCGWCQSTVQVMQGESAFAEGRWFCSLHCFRFFYRYWDSVQ
jgi:hypothetical protein